MAKVAIVTGSATGLGAACAVDLAGRGWNVAINYTKSKKEADETFAKVKAKGAEAILVQADMGVDADCRKLASETLKAWPSTVIASRDSFSGSPAASFAVTRFSPGPPISILSICRAILTEV